MTAYLLIESRDPFECAEVEGDYRLALDLARAGHEVTLFLVQNGVLPARRGSGAALARLAGMGVTVLGDDFSLRERGIGELSEGVRAASLDVVVDGLVRGDRALWL